MRIEIESIPRDKDGKFPSSSVMSIECKNSSQAKNKMQLPEEKYDFKLFY